ncbi:ribonuclease HII [Tepidibacillus infernus]|uniref:Ribonuclease HII n=1 Tax=Tepidibacillus decaturensis TaxID=1413211 RepID=A0A135L424_9BACI|nr:MULTISPECIES: ribonuclease HII [Tepidibacillus]KXG43677.1 ribonuclease HII [Tepidibacillus decaturensis]GBF11653.1 ribonuclease HII [Tepidibacillus sp. HK-1]
MLEHEKVLWSQGIQLIAGIDEVGRGCLFGDVVAASVILPPNLEIKGIDDSKKLTPKKREELFDQITKQAIAIGVGKVDAKTIDQINIKQAARLAMKQAVLIMNISPQVLLIDAEKVDLTIPQRSIIKGDTVSQSIAAASIIAKVTRDRMCEEWDQLYPLYGIKQHKGYATKLHREMIRLHGPSPLHRQSFLGNLLQETLFEFEMDFTKMEG